MPKQTKRGRKPLWDEMDMPSLLPSVQGWALEGSTDEEICQMLGISHDTFYKWKREKSEFAEAIKKGKDVANGEIINSAFRQAMGYYYTEQIATPSGMVVNVEKYQHPSATMTLFMLKNRLPERYKDKHELGVSGQVTHTNEQKTHIIHELVTDEDIAERIKHNYRRGIVSGAGKTES